MYRVELTICTVLWYPMVIHTYHFPLKHFFFFACLASHLLSFSLLLWIIWCSSKQANFSISFSQTSRVRFVFDNEALVRSLNLPKNWTISFYIWNRGDIKSIYLIISLNILTCTNALYYMHMKLSRGSCIYLGQIKCLIKFNVCEVSSREASN